MIIKRYFYLLGLLNGVSIVIVLIFHEKLLNMLDTFTMPINQELCKRDTLRFGGEGIASANQPRVQLSIANLTVQFIQAQLTHLELGLGGIFAPPKTARKLNGRVALIVPYRDRQRNLHIFLYYMHLFLARQNLNYGIFLVEPLKSLKFNRAMLINIGFVEALKAADWDCFVFHDVDLLPENAKNLYTCDLKRPKQMAIAISKYNYLSNSYFKERYFGGVNAFTKDQFRRINGFSNLYFEWGLEDDNARLRVLEEYSNIARLSPEIGQYFANCHQEQTRNPNR